MIRFIRRKEERPKGSEEEKWEKRTSRELILLISVFNLHAKVARLQTRTTKLHVNCQRVCIDGPTNSELRKSPLGQVGLIQLKRFLRGLVKRSWNVRIGQNKTRRSSMRDDKRGRLPRG
jgi:hypothetical protein